jgi:hypothetical protein
MMHDPETDCLFCGGGPDGGDAWCVFDGSEDTAGWIHVRCRDGFVELWREGQGEAHQAPQVEQALEVAS